MARTDVDVEDAIVTGLEATYEAATVTEGDAFLNDGAVVIHVKNENAAELTLTIQTPAKAGGMEIAEQVCVVTGNEERFVGPFPPVYFNQSDGKVYLDCTSLIP